MKSLLRTALLFLAVGATAHLARAGEAEGQRADTSLLTTSEAPERDSKEASPGGMAAEGDESGGVIRTIRIPVVSPRQIAATAGADDEVGEAMEMRMHALAREEAPELVLHHLYTYNDSERILRSGGDFSVAVREEWRFYTGFERGIFLLNEEEDSRLDTELLQLHLGLRGEVTPYVTLLTGLHGHTGPDGEGLGPEGELRWADAEGRSVRLRGTAWAPWDANGLSVAVDGRLHETRMDIRLPLTSRWSVAAETAVTLYELGGEAPNGREVAGESNEWLLRLERALIRIPGRALSGGFFFPGAREEDYSGSQLSLYGEASKKRYTMADDFSAVPVTPETEVLRLGADASLALSRHLAFGMGGYIGSDEAREIRWNRLYGGSFRLVLLPAGRARLWLEGGVDTESASGVVSGRTQRLGGGFNLNF